MITMVMLVNVLSVCAFVLWSGARAQVGAEFREVEIKGQGRVRGFRAPGTDVFAFYSIPYATAPTGDDKFKAPLSPPTWSNTFQAVDRSIVCPQNKILFEHFNVTMQEGCLIANIFVPDVIEANLPVLVIVHGGAFQIGSGNLMTAMRLVNSKKIIAVNFNYRLGIPGFLCLGNEDAPGNAGMKDQVALLRWVRNNIGSFGGNPNDVTVNGCSAGGTSVELLMLSKLTDGLMHKVLPESASSVGSASVQFDPLQNAKEHALLLKFTNVNDIDALTEFYKSLSYDILMQDHFMDRKDGTVVFAACVEKDIGQEIFLEEAPLQILRNGNYKILPVFLGFTNLEGAWRYSYFYEWQDTMNKRFSDFLPSDLEFENDEIRELVAAQIKEFYFGDNAVSNETILSFVNYFSDIFFVQGIMQSAKLQVQAGNKEVYLYEYSFTRSDMPALPGYDIHGANHCFQTNAVMDENEDGLPQGYLEMKATMRELWLDFIVHGNPTPAGRKNLLPTWPPAGVERTPHYSLGQVIEVGGVPVPNRTRFWDALYASHLRMPGAPGAAHLFQSFSKTIFSIMAAAVLLFSSYSC